MPTIIADVIDEKVGLVSYSKAKALFLKWSLENEDFNAKFGNVMDDVTMGFWKTLYRQMIPQLDAIIEDPKAFHVRTGVTDDILTLPNSNLVNKLPRYTKRES